MVLLSVYSHEVNHLDHQLAIVTADSLSDTVS